MSREVSICCITVCGRLTNFSSWLFRLFLGADANMRMVRKKVSSEDADPTLSPGWSYFVEPKKYKEHLAKYQDQKETVSRYLFQFSVRLGELTVLD